jgi:glucose/arabinose dehydrogenase
MFIVEKVSNSGLAQGDVRIFQAGSLVATPYLTVSGISTGSEEGVLGLAFHPQFATNGRLFVDWTDASMNIHITEYHDNGDDTATKVGDVITQDHSQAGNHNGGNVVFGPDGFLYFAFGDGGGGGGQFGTTRVLTTLLSKMSRIDVDHQDASCPDGTPCPYAVPPTNPFVGMGGGTRTEIWAWGLRNPWRWSFDRMTGDLWIGDVGQDAVEEVDFQPAGDPGGEDYGWNIMEGDTCYNASTCDMSGITMPVHTYTHADGCAIMGGYVYRGTALTGHQGDYFFSDECSGWVKSFPAAGAAVVDPSTVVDWPNLTEAAIDSFTEDHSGELYLVTLGGAIYEIVPNP